jgi:hypothetical protein
MPKLDIMMLKINQCEPGSVAVINTLTEPEKTEQAYDMYDRIMKRGS